MQREAKAQVAVVKVHCSVRTRLVVGERCWQTADQHVMLRELSKWVALSRLSNKWVALSRLMVVQHGRRHSR